MRVLLCPDKFKGSVSAQEVCAALKKGIIDVDPNMEVISHPLADGGDGSLEILQPLLNLRAKKINTVDPLGRPMVAEYFHSDDTAFIELASAAGLVLLEEDERDPMLTSTRGMGLMIKDALENNFSKIYLFIGGSATTDGGIGIVQALGFEFLDKQGQRLDPIGANLRHICKVNNRSNCNFNEVEINVLCDVSNPMHGPNGAAYVYGPQKGATTEAVQLLDEGLVNYAMLLESLLSINISNQQGMGAAGAVGASLVGLLDGQLMNGFQMVSTLTNLETAIKNVDVVITGEGRIDRTSFQGKVVGNVLALCKQFSKQCGVVSGTTEIEREAMSPFICEYSIMSLAPSIQSAMSSAEKYLIEIGSDMANRLSRL